MALQYIGARYVPRFTGTYDNTQVYEALDVVDNGLGTSYIAKIPTPAGTPLTNTTYWALYGASSGAIVNLQNQIDDMQDGTVPGSLQEQINTNASGISALTADLNPIKGAYVTPQAYGAKADGVTDDTAAIQAAIDAADVVVFPKSSGEYIFTNLVTHANSRLIGLGGVLKLKDNTAVDNTVDYYPIWAIQDNTVIDGLIIDGNAVNNTQYRVCDTVVLSGKNSKIINCILNNAADSALTISTEDNIEVANNVINGARDCGIYVNALGLDTLKYFVIANNIINGCGTSAIACKRESSKGIINGNMIYDCFNGVSMEAVSPYGSSGDIAITANFFHDITSSIVALRNEKDYVVTGNTFKDFKDHAIVVQECENVTITGNIITSDSTHNGGTYRGAIFVYNPSNSSNDITIGNNAIDITNDDYTFIDVHGNANNIMINGNVINFTDNTNHQNVVNVVGGTPTETVYVMNNTVKDVASYIHDCFQVYYYCNNFGDMRPYQPSGKNAVASLYLPVSNDSTKGSGQVRIIHPFRATATRNGAIFKTGDIVPDMLTADTFKLYVAKADGAGSSVLVEALSVSLA